MIPLNTVEELITSWIHQLQGSQFKINQSNTSFIWSSLYETSPIGVIDPQPNYINTLLLIKSSIFPIPTMKKAKILLDNLKKLENHYGRNTSKNDNRWLSRCIDLDILWWGNLYIHTDELTLPHPRLLHRNFVIKPLAEVLDRSQEIKKINEARWFI